MKRTLLRLSIPFRQPFVTSNGVVSERELLLLRLEASDGTVGWGEAAPFEPYDGVPLERAIAALSGGGGRRPPQARAAEEIARLDLEARQEGRPLADPVRDALPVNMTLAAGPPEEVAARAREGLRAGYACFKVKVGLPDDADRVAAVREAVGPWPALRVDANRAWSVEQAVSCIRTIEDHDLEFVEQPCRSLDELRAVRGRVSTPIAADESVRTARALKRAVELEACDVVNVKVAGAGGFKAAREALAAGALQRARRLPVEHARRALGHRRRASAGRVRGPQAGLRPRDARAVRLTDRARAAGAPQRDAQGAAGPRARRPARARGTCGRGSRRARALVVVVAVVVQLAADLTARRQRAVDVRVREAIADRVHELVELAGGDALSSCGPDHVGGRDRVRDRSPGWPDRPACPAGPGWSRLPHSHTLMPPFASALSDVDVRLRDAALEILVPELVVDLVAADRRLELALGAGQDHRDLLIAGELLADLLAAAGDRRRRTTLAIATTATAAAS